MIVSDDYVLGVATSTYGWPHVVSLYQNPHAVPGYVVPALCGWLTRTYNFSGSFLSWHVGESVCAECRTIAGSKAAP